MARYIKITGSKAVELPGYPERDLLDLVANGSIVILEINDAQYRQARIEGVYVKWDLVVRKPTQDGLYMVQTSSDQGFNYRRVAIWERDHWQSVDGGNRIDVLSWRGPLTVQDASLQQRRAEGTGQC